MLPGAPFANRFDTRWTQTHGTTAGGGNITISNFTSSTSKPVEFDIGNGTPNTVNLTGTTNSTNKLYFKGVGNVSFNGDANLSGGVYAQNLVHEQDTTPDLNFDGNVTLTGAMEFEGKSATFANGVEAAGNDLTLNFSETTTLDGFNNVGNFTSEGAVNLNGTFATTGSQTYNGNVGLAGDSTLSGTTASFSGAIEGNSNNLTLNMSGLSSLTSGLNNVTDFSASGDVELGGNFSTSGAQTFGGNVSLAGDTSMSGVNATFSGITGNDNNLSLNYSGGAISLGGSYSGIADFTAETDVNLNGSFSTSGSQTYNASASLTGDTTLTGISGSFAKGLEGGGNDLTLNFSQSSTLGSLSKINNFTSEGAVNLNGSFDTSGSQTYNDNVTLGGDTTLTSGAGNIILGAGGAVSGTTGNETLTLGDASQTGAVTLGGGSTVTLGGLNIGAGAFDVTIDTANTVNVNDSVDFLNNGTLSITTGAGQSSYVKFRDGLNATAVSQLNLFGAIRTENAPIDLGDVVINNDPGYTYPLGALFAAEDGTQPGANITVKSLDTAGGILAYTVGVTGTFVILEDSNITGWGIQGTGDFEALGNIALGEAGNLTSINTTGDQNYAGNVTLLDNAAFVGSSATFANGVEAAGNDLTLNFSETTTLDGFNNVGNFTSEGAVNLNGTFATTGSQTYNGNVGLAGDSTLSGTTASFSGAIEGNSNNLTLNMSGLSSLTSGLNNVTDFSASGDVELGGNFSTSGAQTFGGNVSLAGDTSMSGVNATFGGITGNDNNLSLNYSGGAISLGGSYSGIADFTAETDVNLNGSFSTSGSQTYNASASLSGDTTLTGTSASFAKGLEGGGNDLTLNFSQASTLGSLSKVNNFTSEGAIDLNGTLDTSGSQTYNGDLSLSGDTSLSGTTASFAGTVEGNGNNFSLNFTGGEIALGGSMSGIGDFTADSAVSLSGNLSTSGSQTYNANASLTGATTLSGSSFSFANGLDAAGNDLTLNFSKTSTLENISNIANFMALDDVAINGTFATSGFQNYGTTELNLLGDTTLEATGFEFGSELAGDNHNLTLRSVGSSMSLTSKIRSLEASTR